MEIVNYNKYENYIRVGESADSLANFPTPSSIADTLNDVDTDAFTDLLGYTHRNRVRHDVLSLDISYSILSDEDKRYILNAISPEWIYVEIKDAKTLEKTVHKMYASEKKSNVFRIVKDSNGDFHTIHSEFGFTLVEQ